MAQYRILGSITYSSQTARNAAQAAINSVLASYPTVVASASGGAIAAGVNTSGSAGLTVSLLAPDDDTAEAVRHALVPAWTGQTRTSAYMGAFKV